MNEFQEFCRELFDWKAWACILVLLAIFGLVGGMERDDRETLAAARAATAMAEAAR